MESFWNTEYGQNLLSVEQTEIDKLLTEPNNTTLEDLFDEDELLQQCSNKNTQLINFLSQHENITKLVSYITRPWQEHMQQIITHLQEQQELEKKSKENDNNNDNDNSTDSISSGNSPLSKNGVHSISAIQEEPELSLNDMKDTKDGKEDKEDGSNTPQALADALMSLENDDDKDESKNNKASDIFSQIINDNIPDDEQENKKDDTKKDQTVSNEKTNEKTDNKKDSESTNTNDTNTDKDKSETKEDAKTVDNNTSNNDTNTQDDDEQFNKYDDLKLSDEEQQEEEETETKKEPKKDTEEDEDDEPVPGLQKKGSIVELLMDGPDIDYSDKPESADISTENKDNNDADPELPDLDVKKENESPNSQESSEGSTSSSSASSDDANSAQQPTLIFDKDSVDIPPPPPPPTQPTKLDEFKSEIGIEKVKLKYPYLASEIINCQIPQILDTILNINNPFLDMLFDFIEQAPPLNAVLTNYWRSCIVGLVRRNSRVILKYIKQRENLLSCLVQHIRDQSIMELVIALGWDPAIEELKELDEVADWMYDQQLVPKLIATLAPDRTPDEHSAASYTLVDIVAKTSRSTNLVLFHNLASSQQIDSLMNHMFAGNRSSLLESLSVLLALLHHYPNVSAEKQQFGDEEESTQQIPSQNTDIPPPPPQQQEETKDNESKTDQATETNINPLAAAALKASASKPKPKTDDIPPPPPPQQKKEEEKVEEEFNDNIPSVVRAVCYRLEEFKNLLESKPNRSLQLPFVKLSPPLGPVRHKVVDMIVALMRTPCLVVSRKLRELGLISICIDLFFEYPWNNLLHGSVEHIIQMVVSGDCQILKKALFEDCDFLNRILSARKLSAQHQQEKKFRLGYMGHITRVSNTIVEFAKRNAQLESYMNSNQEWIKFIGDDLKLENEQLNTQLGGHRPTALGDDDNDDFTLFTLNDITNTDNDNGDNEDLLGAGGYDDDEEEEEDEDRDSDSDSDEDEDGTTNDTNKDNKDDEPKGDDYETPHDAFSRLTQTIDQINDDKDKEKSDKIEDNKGGKGDDFDNWFNNDDNWGNFGNDKDASTNDKDKPKKKEDETPSINGAKTTPNDFENWDDDPFADDDEIFGTDQPAKDKDINNNTKEEDDNMKPPEVMTTDPNEDGLEIPDNLTPSPRPPPSQTTNDESINHDEEANINGHELNGGKKEEEIVNDIDKSQEKESNVKTTNVSESKIANKAKNVEKEQSQQSALTVSDQ